MSRPNAPSNLTMHVVSYNEIDLTWKDNSNNETGFHIERKVGNGSFVLLTTCSMNVTASKDTTVTELTTYSYRVNAFNAQGTSSYSNVVSGSTPAAPFSYVFMNPSYFVMSQSVSRSISAEAIDMAGQVMMGSVFDWSIMYTSGNIIDTTVDQMGVVTSGVMTGSFTIYAATGSYSGSAFGSVIA